MGTINREKVDSIASLKLLTGMSLTNVIEVDNFYADLSGGGNTFTCVSLTQPNGYTSNDGTVVFGADGRVYEADHLKSKDIRQWGAKPNDDTFDNAVIIQRMVNNGSDIVCPGADTFYLVGDESIGAAFIEIEEDQQSYIDFGENVLQIKYDGEYVNARAVMRYNGGTSKPNVNIGKIKIRGEFDYENYIAEEEAQLALDSIPATTGIGRFASQNDARTALISFHVAHEASMQVTGPGVQIEGVQFLGEFGIIKVDTIEGERMNIETCRFNGTNGSLCKIGTLRNYESYGTAITCNSNAGLSTTSRPMTLNIDTLVSIRSNSSLALTSTYKDDLPNEAFCDANVNYLYINEAFNLTKTAGPWDVNINSFISTSPREWNAISMSALWNQYDYIKDFHIGYMEVDGFIGTSPVEFNVKNNNSIVIDYLYVKNTYYISKSYTTIKSGASDNCKDLLGKDSQHVAIYNFRYEIDAGLNYNTMFGGRYNTIVNNQSLRNIKLIDIEFYNMFSFLSNLPYFIYYKTSVLPDLDQDYLTMKNITFYEDVDSTSNKPATAFIRVVKDKGTITIENIKFIRNDVEKTDVNLFYLPSGLLPFIKIEDVKTNLWKTDGFNSGLQTAGDFVVGNFYYISSIGTTDFTLIGASSNTVGLLFTATGVGTGTGTATIKSIAVGKGTLRYSGKRYTWRNSYNGLWYTSSSYPIDEDNGSVMNNGISFAGTGTALDFSNTNGTPYNFGAGDTKSALVYSGSNLKIMGGIIALVNAPSIPSITGGTPIPGSPFVPNIDMHMIGRTFDGINILYHFESLT